MPGSELSELPLKIVSALSLLRGTSFGCSGVLVIGIVLNSLNLSQALSR